MALPFSLPTFEFYQRLNPRERVLALTVAGAVFVVLNLIALSTLLRSFRETRAAYAERSQEYRFQEILAREAPMWTQRMAWLKGRQPALLDRAHAGNELLDQEVKGAARTSQLVLTNPQILPALLYQSGAKDPHNHDYQQVSVVVETEGDWAGTVHFIQSLQRPEAFVVFDLATLRSDPGNASRMRGKFQISKWYAPASK